MASLRNCKVRIDSIAEINPARLDKSFRHLNIKYVDIGNVDRGCIKGFEELRLEDSPSRAQRLARDNDFIISTVRPGNRSYAYIKTPDENMVFSTGFAVIRAIKCDPRYLYYVLTSDLTINYLASIADSKSAYPSINPSDIGEIEISLPPLETQREIAHILGTLDDKIELNRKMSKTLEEMAQTLYKHWFIDFEFPNEEGKPYKSSGGKMKDSELGPIPSMMELHMLSDIVEINPYRSLPKGTNAPYLDMSSVPQEGFYTYINTLREYTSGTKFINGDTLVAKITPCLENGKTTIIGCLKEGQVAWGSSEFYVLRPKGKIPPLFAYMLARNNDFRNHLINSMTGSSGRQRVPLSSISNYSLPSHSIDSMLFEQYNERVSKTYTLIMGYMLQNEILDMIKKSIIDRLISSNLNSEATPSPQRF